MITMIDITDKCDVIEKRLEGFTDLNIANRLVPQRVSVTFISDEYDFMVNLFYDKTIVIFGGCQFVITEIRNFGRMELTEIKPIN